MFILMIMLNLTVLHVKPNDVRTIETSQADGVIKCVVERPITSNDSNVFPLTESWYLLHAIGPVVTGELKHKNCCLSKVTVSITL